MCRAPPRRAQGSSPPPPPQDVKYNAIAKEFAASQDAFFAAFGPAFAKLMELGCADHVKTQVTAEPAAASDAEARL